MRKEPLARTRQDLSSMLEDRMAKTSRDLLQFGKYEYEGNLVKTFLLDAHIGQLAPAEFLQEELRATFSKAKTHHILHETDEEELAVLEVQGPEKGALLYIDSVDPRFWRVHTMSNGELVDQVMDGLATRSRNIDFPWLPISFLEEVAAMGSLQGLGLEYEQRVKRNADEPLRRFSMQSITTEAEEVVDVLRGDERLGGTIAVAKVKVRFFGGYQQKFCYDDVRYNGRVTVRGNSFQTHLDLVNVVYDRYSSHVRQLEEESSLRYEDLDGPRLVGAPIGFLFEPPIDDLQLFCDGLFTAGPPFRLWGVPVTVTPKMVRVRAIDLHVGHTINFEVTPEFLRLYLPEGSCANTVFRLLANLQHHFDARVRAIQPITGELL